MFGHLGAIYRIYSYSTFKLLTFMDYSTHLMKLQILPVQIFDQDDQKLSATLLRGRKPRDNFYFADQL